ncbi:hypothetical protein DPMN_073624 [Dreissena polymorpha]|uniref:Uncharacterized protein n=1 Tax=Dreissena polymorpha TaxID=45954 RepID=A0A9D4BZF4_DREPO|nr:hypothetical protein DPMN_073624 [Dreissena polymorpha]
MVGLCTVGVDNIEDLNAGTSTDIGTEGVVKAQGPTKARQSRDQQTSKPRRELPLTTGQTA